MKKFILRTGLFIVCLAVLDLAIGCLCGFLRSHAKGGSTQNNYYIAEQCIDDIIILGSSRATHHYIPSIITDSLGLSCYNCGEEGNGSILAAARLGMLTERYTPKLVIYEVTPRYDYLVDTDYSKYLRYLKPYYHKTSAHKMVDEFTEPGNKLKMLSSMYRNNFAILAYCVDNLTFRDNRKGYEPLFGQMKEYNSKEPELSSDQQEVDKKKLVVMQDIIESCKEKRIPLLFVVSPNYEGEAGEIYNTARLLAQENGISFLDYSGLEEIAHNYSFFQDYGHMNDKGAQKFTRIFVKEINNYLCK